MTAKNNRWALMGAGLTIAASVAGAAFYFERTEGAVAAEPAAAAAPQAIPVTVAAVETRNVATWQEFSGRLEAVGRVQIRPRVAGAIQSIEFREGALVKAGGLLVTIDPEPYKAAVAQAEGQVASAEARLDYATTELERGERLTSKNVLSDSDLAQRRSAKAEAVAAVQSAKAALRVAGLELGYTEVRAPISGRVGRREITEGNLVAAGSGSPVLTTLVSVDPIYASFDVNEDLIGRTLAQLGRGSTETPDLALIPVELATGAGEGTAIRGKLQLIDNEVNAQSGTVRVRAIFDNPGGQLLPGQFVRIRMGDPTPENHLMISEKAVGTDQDKKFVFVVDPQNTVAYRQIELGSAVDGQRIVEKGLNAGDRIVVNGLQRIRPGALVDPQTEAKVAQQ
ncbi:multidrug efflux system membrane fusion protein [Rhizobium sp. PP-F2F-G38]|uniref:Efflux RND transporter periplasmic adaptor subunit n=1 Tax=Ferranicluibacter rubi TaxID=2715133 RepID=A0AA43ZJ69_9HYPH|nr:efflux RND transporter periplasmic adaptor subunit [Ferranicluibacter rubi]PYE32430.1 multidrug efflux system membrane fusion protein [Rhizobium sp. PP-WC-1G-195]PYE95858.1 multidrug efflux system membrane fusion protein [Rhizobium sp. PP-F2F-G38]TCP77962.1 multidrug efflux system membrane fusion protein [Rhizobium sp. PP-CC-2G-626]TCQ22798.1 multidrug efflux system membrane fusion protein [Rhizobium sp. PP-CC-3G-465]NHT78898.1 efflux RND transporter periplasmic adaptor subunit [Ferraniclui